MEQTKLKRMNVIELIMRIESEKVLAAIEQEALRHLESQQTPNVWEAARPIRSNVSLEQIMEEQNYRPISYEEFRALAKEVELDDPIEELLADLRP